METSPSSVELPDTASLRSQDREAQADGGDHDQLNTQGFQLPDHNINEHRITRDQGQVDATRCMETTNRVDQNIIVEIPQANELPHNQGVANGTSIYEHGSTSGAETPANPPVDHDSNSQTRGSPVSKLRQAALKGDWEKAEPLLKENEGCLYNARITHRGETALHLAAVEGHWHFVYKLLEHPDINTKIQNENGYTALSLAATAGHVRIARELIRRAGELIKEKRRDLQKIWQVTPLHQAVSRGHKEMADILLTNFDFSGWESEDQVELLMVSIESGLYDLANTFLKNNGPLAAALRKGHGWTALEELARSPSAFCANKQQGLWAAIIGFLKCNKSQATSSAAYKLFGSLWDNMMPKDDLKEVLRTSEDALRLPFIAAESGNDGFLVELINRHPDFLYNVNESNLSIFHIAVKYRYVRIFNLIYELDSLKDLTMDVEDASGNNILHLAAKIAPQNYLNSIPSPALQMRREVLWYKEVEKIVQPSYRNKENAKGGNRKGKTPNDIFLEEHRELMKEGEKCIKQIAKSCMLVTILITTLVFTTAFTPPGGYDNNTGVPILENNRYFKVFPISQAVATLSSLISTVMFLFVLTSRYEKTDFLNSLPKRLLIGVATLLISIVAMMVEFCMCLLLFEHVRVIINVILVLFASELIIFVILINYPRLVTILGSTRGGSRLFRSENRLFPE